MLQQYILFLGDNSSEWNDQQSNRTSQDDTLGNPRTISEYENHIRMQERSLAHPHPRRSSGVVAIFPVSRLVSGYVYQVAVSLGVQNHNGRQDHHAPPLGECQSTAQMVSWATIKSAILLSRPTTIFSNDHGRMVFPFTEFPPSKRHSTPLDPLSCPHYQTAPSVVPDPRLVQTEIRNWTTTFH